MKIIRPSLEIVTHGGINMDLQEAVAAVAEAIRRWALDVQKAFSDFYSLFGGDVYYHVYYHRKKKRRRHKRPRHSRKRLRQIRRRRRRDQSRKVIAGTGG